MIPLGEDPAIAPGQGAEIKVIPSVRLLWPTCGRDKRASMARLVGWVHEKSHLAGNLAVNPVGTDHKTRLIAGLVGLDGDLVGGWVDSESVLSP